MGDPASPRELMRGAWLMMLFWAVGTLVAAIKGDDYAIAYLAFTNLWVVAMWLGRYLQRTLR